MSVLMLAVFTVSVGFGVLLPLLPSLIERLLGPGGGAAEISRSTGLLTALYMFALFLFAPVWGGLSDRYGRRLILLIGLAGFGAITLTFSFIESLTAVYAERFLSGVFAAAVAPVALATIGDLEPHEAARARRLTFISLAGISGFLIGPILGVAITRGVSNLRAFPSSAAPTRWLIPRLLVLAFIVAAGVGVFEVGLALLGTQELGLTPYQIAVMFTECSLGMFVVQALVFSPWIKPATTRWLIAPGLGVLAAGIFLTPRAAGFTLILAVVGMVAASAGILSPILTYWVSSTAGGGQGSALGRLTAASSIGAAAGSAAGGLLFDVALVPHASFLLATIVTASGALISLGLPHQLTRTPEGA